nr:retrotransposon Orf1 [Tanacetum cinerariifolium]
MKCFEPSHVGTLAHASIFGRSLSLRGADVSGQYGKFRAEVLRPQLVEWDGPHALECNILCKDIFKDLDVCRKALNRMITPAELRRTESLLPLELSNRVNILTLCSQVIFREGSGRNLFYFVFLRIFQGVKWKGGEVKWEAINMFCSEKLDKKKGDVKLHHLEVTSLDNKLENLQREQALTLRDLQNELVLEKSKSQGYKDAMDGLREEVTQFVGSGVESLIRKLLSSDEFYAALACVASLGINYGVERGLRMGRTDVEFKATAQKVFNFHVGIKADFDKALNDFPTTPFPFLSKIIAASEVNFMPSTPDLSFTGLDEFANKPVVENCKAKSSEEETKAVKKNDDASIIEEWVSDDKEKNVTQPKIEKKIVRPNMVKKEFVKSRLQEKNDRKIIKQVEQNRQSTHSPRGNQRNWNNMMSQKLGSHFEMFNKACYVCGIFDHLQISNSPDLSMETLNVATMCAES